MDIFAVKNTVIMFQYHYGNFFLRRASNVATCVVVFKDYFWQQYFHQLVKQHSPLVGGKQLVSASQRYNRNIC